MWQVQINFLFSNTDLHILAPSFAQWHSKWGKAEIVSAYMVVLILLNGDNDLN